MGALCETAVVVQAVGSLLGVGLGVRDKHSHLWILFCNVELPWKLLPCSQDGCCSLAAAAVSRSHKPHRRNLTANTHTVKITNSMVCNILKTATFNVIHTSVYNKINN